MLVSLNFRFLLSILLFALLVNAAHADQDNKGSSLLTQEGWISCAAFLRMDFGQKTFYLRGLHEGLKVGEFSLQANLESEKMPDQVKPGMRGSANLLQHMADHSGITFGEIMKRTEIQCEHRTTSGASLAWLKAIQEIQQLNIKK